MRYLYTGKQAKEIDSHAIRTVGIPSLVLMEKAAMTVAAILMEREGRGKRILAVCGTGNNGGDGVAVARILHGQGYKAAVTVVGEPARMTDEMRRQMEIAVNCKVPILPTNAISDHEFDVLVDGVFGIGLSRDVGGVYRQVIESMNGSGAGIYALDVPSGIHAGTGAVLGTAVRAQCTVTFGVNKVGLVLYPGCAYAGEVIVGDIGFPEASVSSVEAGHYYYEPEDVFRQLPARPPRSHKGTFGKVLVVAGCETMSGAALLAAKAAYRMGAGLVKVVSTPDNREILLSSLPEILFDTRDGIADAVDWADAIVVGPGLGLAEEAEELVRHVIVHASVPTVVDGDGIRLFRKVTEELLGVCQDKLSDTCQDKLSDALQDKLSDTCQDELPDACPEKVADTMRGKVTDELVGMCQEKSRVRFVLTPHVKEMSVLTGISVEELQRDLPGTTKAAAGERDCVVVQKDARTVVSDGRECYINVSGNNGMATGGAGDVLAGMIGGLLGQHMEPFAAARLGVYLHGLGGDVMAREKGTYSLMASDIIAGIPTVLRNG